MGVGHAAIQSSYSKRELSIDIWSALLRIPALTRGRLRIKSYLDWNISTH